MKDELLQFIFVLYDVQPNAQYRMTQYLENKVNDYFVNALDSVCIEDILEYWLSIFDELPDKKDVSNKMCYDLKVVMNRFVSQNQIRFINTTS